MFFCFIDDSKQRRPSRSKMGPLVAIGGVIVNSRDIKDIEKQLNALCEKYSFPQLEKFKYSPGRELWMRDNLKNEKRKKFFSDIFKTISNFDIKLIVVIEDTKYACASDSSSHELDCIKLFIERLNRVKSDSGIIICDRPSGDRKAEKKFSKNCFNIILKGTEYLIPEYLLMNIIPADSCFIRLLQIADVVTSCTLALVAGEKKYAPQIFNSFKDLFHTGINNIAGAGLKIHPDSIYVNLYYWLLGNNSFCRSNNTGISLPNNNYPYYSNEDKY